MGSPLSTLNFAGIDRYQRFGGDKKDRSVPVARSGSPSRTTPVPFSSTPRFRYRGNDSRPLFYLDSDSGPPKMSQPMVVTAADTIVTMACQKSAISMTPNTAHTT